MKASGGLSWLQRGIPERGSCSLARWAIARNLESVTRLAAESDSFSTPTTSGATTEDFERMGSFSCANPRSRITGRSRCSGISTGISGIWSNPRAQSDGDSQARSHRRGRQPDMIRSPSHGVGPVSVQLRPTAVWELDFVLQLERNPDNV